MVSFFYREFFLVIDTRLIHFMFEQKYQGGWNDEYHSKEKHEFY